MQKNFARYKVDPFSRVCRQYRYMKWALRLRIKQTFAREDNWIFSRTACLGNDSLALTKEYSLLFRMNLQKARSDLLIRKPDSLKKLSPLIIQKFISRGDITPHIWAQSNRQFQKMPRPLFIVIDSYSDLTDVEFFHQATGSSFFCHKSDLFQLDEGEINLSIRGLLNLDEVESLYRILIYSLRNLWGVNIKIFFIHYPTKLEVHDLYLTRAKIIEKAVDNLANLDKYLYPIKIPEALVHPEIFPNGEISTFPYHYSLESKTFIAAELSKIMNCGF